MIDNLRKRKARIIAYLITAILASAALIFSMRMYARGLETIRAHSTDTTPLIEIAIALSRVYTSSILFAAFAGIALGLLVVEMTGRSKDHLTVAMWDDIQILKQKVEQGGPGYPPQGVGSPDP